MDTQPSVVMLGVVCPIFWFLQAPPTLTELHDPSSASKPLKTTSKQGTASKKDVKKVSGSEDGGKNLATPGLSHDKLLHILKGYGEYPAKYR